MNAAELAELEQYLTPSEMDELEDLLVQDIEHVPWRPMPGPQTMAYNSKADIIGFGGAAGGGKGLALDTLLPTPTGFVAMADVTVGDAVFDERGAPCRVTAVSEPANRPCFRLVFDDGTDVVADDVHRWVTFTAGELAKLSRSNPAWRAARRASRLSRAKATTSPARLDALARLNANREAGPPPQGVMRTTQEMHDTLRTHTGRANHAVRVAGGLALPDAELPVPPYTLGAWLGDGSSRNGQLTSEDPEVWQRIEAEGFEVRHYHWNRLAHNVIGLKVKLRGAGVLEDKHIPPAYMRASPGQRLALLQGLMDTDGHAALDGGCEFDGVNARLVRGVFDLVRSLGIKAFLQQGVAKLNGRVTGPKWRVKFTTTTPVFGLQRKVARLKDTVRRTQGFRYLVSCDPIPSVPTRCIAVDSPTRQYLATAAMLPTHNTDLIVGTILTKHKRSLVARREKAQTEGIVQRMTAVIGGSDGLNGQKGIWKLSATQLLELAGLDNPGDERRWQGRDHGLKAFDEVTEMREAQVRFVMGWTRTPDPDEHAQVLMTFNPPTTNEGRWVIKFFGPWLDRTHPKFPAKPGSLHYAAMLPDGQGGHRDIWLENGDPFIVVDDKPCYDFDPMDHKPEDIIVPKSRTFVPSKVTDNPYYVASGYISTLQALPEPLRSQMLKGDFLAGMEDDAMQVVPTAWVEAAQARWRPRAPKGEMLQQGVDVARGGKDSTIVFNRHRCRDHDWYFAMAEPLFGTNTNTGPKVMAHVLSNRRDDAPVNIDIIGIGASPYDFMVQAQVQVLGVNVAERANGTDKSGALGFFNTRSELIWRLREMLDPDNDTGAELPPETVCPGLLGEITTPRWELSGRKIKVESREDIITRLGHSPDMLSALALAAMEVPKRAWLTKSTLRNEVIGYDPIAALDNARRQGQNESVDYDPMRGV